MTYETLLWEQRDRAVCITLNRPQVLNSISVQMMWELAAAYKAAEDDPGIWTVIVTGTGRALCTGADLGVMEMNQVDGRTNGVDTWGEPMLGSMRQWEVPQEATPPYLQMAKPVICAVNGIACGAGLDLVTTSDIAIAADNAVFFDPHVSIGLVSGREMVRAARSLPVNVAMRMALLGKHEKMTAQRAYELGMVTELTKPEDLMARAWELAALVNRNAPLAVRGTRLAIRKGLSLPVYEAEILAESYRMRVAQTRDAQEGVDAFLEKRQPVWQAR
jgi:enoyl-CoA hydratase/carnithine racemase